MLTKDEKVNELLLVLEHQMKELWAQYMNSVEQNGQNEIAQELRRKYFEIYHSYKNKKEWLMAIENV